MAPAFFVRLNVCHVAAEPVDSGSMATMELDASVAPPVANRMPPEQKIDGVKKLPGMSPYRSHDDVEASKAYSVCAPVAGSVPGTYRAEPQLAAWC